ncbi:MAG: hypothetical protein U5O69_02750 [Candidatus Competibacteraceae bacterium]|nr:hypothetical protein [Candidatus Competibacteraceae bacterium]
MNDRDPIRPENGPNADEASAAPPAARQVFALFLIKPSHYDDDGYVIQWARSSIPSNTLAAMFGLALDCVERRVLGDAVEIRVTAWDETHTRVRPERIVREIVEAGAGLVCLVGVQTNQFPRAVDLARPLRAAGVPVCIGGFHVSGCLAMLPTIPSEMRHAMDLGITLFAGEAEGRFEPSAGRPRRAARTAVQLHGGTAGDRGHADPLPPGRRGARDERDAHQLRRGARLSVSVQFLHDHQRAGTPVAHAQSGRYRAYRAGKPRAGYSQLLHHRR